jgi:hypothetical protein
MHKYFGDGFKFSAQICWAQSEPNLTSVHCLFDRSELTSIPQLQSSVDQHGDPQLVESLMAQNNSFFWCGCFILPTQT